jgi:hypothetical protein
MTISSLASDILDMSEDATRVIQITRHQYIDEWGHKLSPVKRA